MFKYNRKRFPGAQRIIPILNKSNARLDDEAIDIIPDYVSYDLGIKLIVANYWSACHQTISQIKLFRRAIVSFRRLQSHYRVID